jgi:hypothetical protein
MLQRDGWMDTLYPNRDLPDRDQGEETTVEYIKRNKGCACVRASLARHAQ